MFDGIIRKNLRRQQFQIGLGGSRVDPVLATGGDRFDSETEVHEGSLRAVGNVVRHTRLEHHIQQLSIVGRLRGGFRQRVDRVRLDDGIDQKGLRGPFDLFLVQVALNQERFGCTDLVDRREPHRLATALDPGRFAVNLGGQRTNLNFPQHDALFPATNFDWKASLS